MKGCPLCTDALFCCRHVNDPEVIVRALAGVWRLMDAALTAYSGDASAIERLCKLPRYALRTSGAAAAPLLQPLLATLPARFEASGHSSYLYVASELVKLFGADTAHDAGISAPCDSRSWRSRHCCCMCPSSLPSRIRRACQAVLR